MPYNDDTSAHDEWYPLSQDDRHWIDRIVQLIQSHTPHMSPIELRGASTVLLALARLPRSSPGIDVEFGFRTEPIHGNHAWAYISVSDDGFVLGVGEHFYDPAVGGDTESRRLFATQAASRCRRGCIESWLDIAAPMSDSRFYSVQDDNCDYEVIASLDDDPVHDWDEHTDIG